MYAGIYFAVNKDKIKVSIKFAILKIHWKYLYKI